MTSETRLLMSLQNQDKYRGKWVAILDNKVVAEGTDIRDVSKKALKKIDNNNYKTPLLHRIPKKDELGTLIL